MLGGCAVALQDWKRREVRAFSLFSGSARRKYHVSAEFKHARREISIRRIMKVDASVLLHSWSLAAAAATGRMIGARSATGTARAALFRPESDGPTYTDRGEVQPSFDNIHNPLPPGLGRPNDCLFADNHMVHAVPCFLTSAPCHYVDYCYCFTGHTRNTTALRHSSLPRVRPERTRL
jgi:hypothetical protein